MITAVVVFVITAVVTETAASVIIRSVCVCILAALGYASV